MKYISLLILLLSSSLVIGAPRQAIETRSKVENPLPDDVRDSLLLTYGTQIATNIAQAMINNDDPKDYLTLALTGLYNFVQTVVRKPIKMRIF